MIAGLPACGIGGVFYLISAFLMPVFELNKMLRRKARKNAKERWKLIAFELIVSCSMIAGFWLTGNILGHLFAMGIVSSKSSSLAVAQNVVQLKPFLFSTILLIFLLSIVHFQSIIVARKSKKFMSHRP